MSRTKTHTAKSTYRAINQIHLTLHNLINSPFLPKEDNEKIYEMYNETLRIRYNAARARLSEERRGWNSCHHKSKKYGDRHETYLTEEEMNKLGDNRLVRYFRCLKSIYWRDDEVAKDPTCLDRAREAKCRARDILIQRGVLVQESDETT